MDMVIAAFARVIVHPGRLLKPVQYAAIPNHMVIGTSYSQIAQFLLKSSQFADAGHDVSDVFVQKPIDSPAAFRRRILELQKCPDLLERHVQATAMTDEG